MSSERPPGTVAAPAGRPPSGPAAPGYSAAWRTFSKIILRPLIPALMRLQFRGTEHIPADGGVIIAANHLSYADVLALSLFADRAGRYPVFLAKSSLFRRPGLGLVLRKLGQLPVYREQMDAALVLRAAAVALRAGACVIIYPEATITRDPDLWPMAAKGGVARLALDTGVPVLPVAHWGAQDVLPARRPTWPRLVPRRQVQVAAGPPVDLSGFAGRAVTPAVLREATAMIMTGVTGVLAQLRHQDPPAVPFRWWRGNRGAPGPARPGPADQDRRGR